MGTFLLFGTLWFWLAIIITVIGITACTEFDDNQKCSSLWVIVLGLALYFCGNSVFFNDLGAWIINNPIIFIGWIAVYFLSGVVWSFFKWGFYLRRIREQLIKDKSKFPNSFAFNRLEYTVSNNKERILHWMIYWPLSGIWTLINDPVNKIFEFFLSKISKIYDKMSAHTLKDL